MVLQNVEKAQVRLSAKKDNVAGVTLPVFETTEEGTDSNIHNTTISIMFYTHSLVV